MTEHASAKLTEREFMSAADIQQMQLGLIKDTLKYVQQNSAYYRETFAQSGFESEDFQDFADLRKLPTTGKGDIQGRNADFFCVPEVKVVDFVSTSGTTGDPILFPLTQRDLDRLALNEALSFACANTVPEDSFQIMVNLGNLFVAGLAYYLGLVKLGATTYRIGAGLTQRQLYLLNKLRPTGLVSVPSFLVKLREAGLEQGIDVKELGLEKIVLIGETIIETDLSLNPLGQKILDGWGTRPFSSYASTEMSTSFAECSAHMGLHSHPELIYCEILDDAGEPVPDGMFGELVVTTLQAEGMPLIRYQTGDITYKMTGSCACGRNTERLGPVIGRKNQMIKLKGTTIFPGQLEKALVPFEEIKNFVIEVSTGKEYTDEVTLKVGVTQETESLLPKLKASLNAVARVTPEIQVLSPAAVEKLLYVEGKTKAQKFIDLRNQKGA